MLNALIWTGRNTPLGRGKTRRLLIAAARRIVTGPITTDYRGVPIILHLDNITERKALFSAYDRTEMEFLLPHLTGQDAVFVDIGANSGLYTQWLAAHMAKGAKIVAIEPNPQMCARIQANIDLLGSKPETHIECCAAGEDQTTMRLDLSHGLGAATLNNATGIEVSVRPLATILQDAGCKKTSALKIDVEGYEDRVLMPFFRDAPEGLWPRAIAAEFVHQDQWHGDLMTILKNCGYQEMRRTRANLLLRRMVD